LSATGLIKGQDYLISDGGTINTCIGSIFDNGGPSDTYSNDRSDVLTVCSATPGECIKLDFLLFDLEQGYDFMRIYAGEDISAPLYGEYTGSESPGSLSLGTECITLWFTSDYSVTEAGFDIAVSCECPSCEDGILNGQELATDCGGPDCPACNFNSIDEGGTITGCDMTLFDSGLESNYGSDEDYIMTFCAEDELDSLFIEFLLVQVGIGDHLYLYDGEGIGVAPLADITAAVNWPDLFSSSSCVTFHFVSNGTGNSQGFQIDMTCAGEIVDGLADFGDSDYEISMLDDSRLLISHPRNAMINVEIFDIAGRIVLREGVLTGKILDLRALPTDQYILVLYNKGLVALAKRIFIQR
jgi:hypothetical protein